ncbi:MAG: tRNA (adenosine(37)-N6)-threonylcarbamoyltransferase complex dimerization subunit type 1 TsaB, partial [Gammaproteobacteria bacterium]|nr:tRNA (adenosine(37)-N6)-threonylcarbamoyltransferase complex dimerization subunit type 1 TsaB [Gammaproteobacteria bacterium]
AREAHAERGHGGQLLSMVGEMLAEAGIGLGALDAIAFGRGPGSFTGLRLGASVTQGLAFAAALPVIAVSDLRALAQQCLAGAADGARALACHDARMGEVYWAGFTAVRGHASAATAESVHRPADMLAAASRWLGDARAAGVGTGFAAYAALATWATRLEPLLGEARPRASEIARLAAHDGLGAALPAEQAWPVYVRDNVAVAGDSQTR